MLEVTDFKYKEIAPGIWYPASYTMHFHFPDIICKIAASHFEVNIDIPKEAFMIKTEKRISELISAVKKDLGFNKIKTMRCKLRFKVKNNKTWEMNFIFKRPSYLKKETRVYNEKGEILSKVLSITDGVNIQNINLDPATGEPRYIHTFPLKELTGFQWASHPLFEFYELNPRLYSEIEEGSFKKAKVYILRSKRKGIPPIECWVTAHSPHKIVKFVVRAGQPSFYQVTDFKYKEVAPGIWYPVSYLREDFDQTLKTSSQKYQVTDIKVNIDVPDETFMFMPVKRRE